MLRRAAFIEELPISKDTIRLGSDSIEDLDWTYGVDYVDMNLTDEVHVDDRLIEALNKHLTPSGIRILDSRTYTEQGKMVSASATHAWYRMPLLEELKKPIEKFQKALNAEEITCTIKKTVYPSRVVTEKYNAKPLIHKMWISKDEDGLMWANFILQYRVNPYSVYRGIFGSTSKGTLKAAAERVEFLMLNESDQVDMFRPSCADCGEPLQINLFDEFLHERLCLRCLAKENGTLVC
jgi:hypothetical protein